MYIFLFMLAFAVVAGTINFGWDFTFRRLQARRLTEQRRNERPRALPPPPSPAERAPLASTTQAFVAHTRMTFVALDELIDRFDLLRLRARARSRIGAAFVNVVKPRAQAMALLESWLIAFRRLDAETLRRLDEVALGPATVAEVFERERERASWEFRADTEPTLADTSTDLDRAVIHMQQIVRILEAGPNDPYRGAER